MKGSTGSKVIAGANETTRKLNPHVYAHTTVQDGYKVPAGKTLCEVFKEEEKNSLMRTMACGAASELGLHPKPAKRIRQSTQPLLDELEKRFEVYMRIAFGAKLIPQALRFKLGNGIWYKPDFVRIRTEDIWTCYEVKGPHAFRGGFENLKVAAHQWPMIQWVLAWEETPHGKWLTQEILP